MGFREITAGWVVALLVVGACEAPPGDVADVALSDATLVGTVAGSDALVAVVVEDNHVGAYTCGGDDTLMKHTEWFMGTAHVVDESTVWIDCGATSFTIAFSDDGSADGFFIDDDGTSWDWTARPAQPDTLAGLYRAFDPACSTGAIVMQDSPDDAPLVQGAWCDGAGDFRQVVPMEPVQLTEQGIEVEIPFDVPERVFVEPFAF